MCLASSAMRQTATRASAYASFCTRWLPGSACDHGQRYGMYIQESIQGRLFLSHTAAAFGLFAARQRPRAGCTTPPQGAFPRLTTVCCTVPLCSCSKCSQSTCARAARRACGGCTYLKTLEHLQRYAVSSDCTLTKADLFYRMPRLRWRPLVPRWHSCGVTCTSARCAMSS